MWFDKEDSRVLYIDNRDAVFVVDKRSTPCTKGRSPRVVAPDLVACFTQLPYDSGSFFHVVFDPPHLLPRKNPDSVIRFNYGQLNENWKEEIEKGFSECFRVLKPGGTLIFKWSETDIKVKEILQLTPEKPLYGHKSGKASKTHWIAFIKEPS